MNKPPTQRQLRVLELLVEEGSYKAVGQRMNIRPWTVKSHVQSLYRNLGVTTRSQAIAVAIRDGYLP